MAAPRLSNAPSSSVLCGFRLRLAQLDRKIAEGKNFTEVDSNTYLAWNNSYCRTLARLGIEPPRKGSKPSIKSILAKAQAP